MPSRRGINDETQSIGVGCVDFDVVMAREFGWTEADIQITWETIAAAYRATSQQVAARNGRTRQCPVCECWTVPRGPCHLCANDEARAAQQGGGRVRRALEQGE